MIDLHCGTPGSGKTLRNALDIKDAIFEGLNVITNIPINERLLIRKHKYDEKYQKELLKKKNNRSYASRSFNNRNNRRPFFSSRKKHRKKEKGTHSKFFYVDRNDISVKYLVDFSRKYHVFGKESQTLVVIDEAHLLYNKRDWRKNQQWVDFYSQHRKFGFDFVFITQNESYIDSQICGCVENLYRYRRLSGFKSFGRILKKFNIGLFAKIKYWYRPDGQGSHERDAAETFFYKNKYSRLFDSYKIHSQF